MCRQHRTQNAQEFNFTAEEVAISATNEWSIYSWRLSTQRNTNGIVGNFFDEVEYRRDRARGDDVGLP